MKTNSKHSPQSSPTAGPWVVNKINPAMIHGFRGFHQDTPQVVAIVEGYCDHEQQANAQLIVTAVNSHTALVGALEGLLAVNEAECNCGCCVGCAAVKNARAALALALGEQS